MNKHINKHRQPSPKAAPAPSLTTDGHVKIPPMTPERWIKMVARNRTIYADTIADAMPAWLDIYEENNLLPISRICIIDILKGLRGLMRGRHNFGNEEQFVSTIANYIAEISILSAVP
jgi:hypothetical protein